MLEFLENALLLITDYGILVLEFVGVAIILCTAIRCLICGIKHNGIVPLMLGKGIALALEFMLASEVLRTVNSADAKNLALVGATVVLRAAMTVLIHWESRAEKKEEEEKQSAVQPIRPSKAS